jgi:hypothetical protein
MTRLIVVLLSLAAVVSGCSKKADQAQQAPAAPAATPEAAPAAATPTADASAQPAPGPVLDTSQMVGDAKQAMAEADAALRQKEYEKAVRTMLAIQQAQLNAQQAALAHQQMVNLQRNLAAAIASGDPNAAAAGEILRAAHRH